MKLVAQPLLEGAIECRTGDWGEVVTRYHYRKVGMDHLLSMEKDKTVSLATCMFCLVLRDYFSQEVSSLKT